MEGKMTQSVLNASFLLAIYEIVFKLITLIVCKKSIK